MVAGGEDGTEGGVGATALFVFLLADPLDAVVAFSPAEPTAGAPSASTST
jgi:hypothetical protein